MLIIASSSNHITYAPVPRILAITLVVLLTATATATGLSGRAVSKPSIPGSPQIIQNGDCTNGTAGWVSSPIGEINGQYCVAVPANTPSGNASNLRTDYTFLDTKNDVYTLNFTASSTMPYDILVRTSDSPLDQNLNRTICGRGQACQRIGLVQAYTQNISSTA